MVVDGEKNASRFAHRLHELARAGQTEAHYWTPAQAKAASERAAHLRSERARLAREGRILRARVEWRLMASGPPDEPCRWPALETPEPRDPARRLHWLIERRFALDEKVAYYRRKLNALQEACEDLRARRDSSGRQGEADILEGQIAQHKSEIKANQEARRGVEAEVHDLIRRHVCDATAGDTH